MTDKTTQTTQTPEVQVIKIGDKLYDMNTATDLTLAILKDVKAIEDQLNSYGLQLSIAKLARAKLIDELYKELPKLTEVQNPETADTANAEVKV